MTVVLSYDLLLVLLHLNFLHNLLMLEIRFFLFLKLLLLLIWIFSSWHHLCKLVDRGLMRLVRILRVVFNAVDRAERNLWWVTLGYYIQWLLYILKNNFAALFESSDLNFNDFTNWFPILFYIFNTLIILNDPRDAQVERTEDDPLLDVFNEG